VIDWIRVIGRAIVAGRMGSDWSNENRDEYGRTGDQEESEESSSSDDEKE